MPATLRSPFAFLLPAFISLASSAVAQQPELALPEKPENYSKIAWPKHFAIPPAQAMDTTPAENPTTDAGAALGRVLFYDVRLSASGEISCASCHIQEHGFSDPRKVSVGHLGRKGDRNSMGLVNLRFTQTGLFWDERVATLEEQVLVPMQSPVEMGSTLEHVVSVVENDDRYAPLFEQAFGEKKATAEKIARALAQFLRALVSHQSKYDEGLAAVKSMADDFPNFSAEENQGKAIFREKCSICHQNSRGARAESFEMFAALNNGVNASGLDRDGGQGDLTFDPANVGLFKAASLRNIAKTAPYMHDGRFATLEEVIHHYSEGVNKHPSVSGFVFRMRFTPQEKQALLAFLQTLTDEKFLSDPKFANPWKMSGPSETLTSAEAPAPSPVSSPKMLSEAERAALLAAGRALPDAEVLPWLQSLDTDRDRQLDAAEFAPLIEIMLKTGVSPRLNTQRFNRQNLRIGGTGRAAGGLLSFDKDKNGAVTAEEAPQAFHELIALSDLDGSGGADESEIRLQQAFQRLIEIDDQGRDRARLDRFLADYGVDAAQTAEAKSQVKTAQNEFAERQIVLNRELAGQLESVMGEAKYAAFRDLLLARPDPRPAAVTGEGAKPDEQLRQRLLDFDENGDGKLAELELSRLADVLKESPGGFGQVAPEYPNTKMHAQRLIAFGTDGKSVGIGDVPDRLRGLVREGDRDGDSRLTFAEAEGLLREKGFQNLLTSGVYVGGGFGNVFGSAELLVDKLQLSGDAAAQVKQLMLDHQGSVKQLASEIVSREYVALRRFRSASHSVPSTVAAPRE